MWKFEHGHHDARRRDHSKLRHIMRPLTPAGFCLALLLCACGSGGPPQPTANPVTYASQTAIVSSFTESLSPDEMREVADTTIDGPYRLGPSDVISVEVYLHPELNSDVSGATVNLPDGSTSGNSGDALITSDGTTELPLIGNIALGGLTLPEAQQRLTDAYAKYIVDPKIAVQLQSAQSLRYYLLGAFQQPGVKFPVHPLNLLEALALGGSVDIPTADLRQAYVAQGSVKLPVDLYALLVEGDLSQNVSLAPGDAIVIPSSASEDAFVFGSVTKPGQVQFLSGGMSLLQALSSAGMDLTSLTNAELSQIHIIRGNGRTAQFLVVNANLILQGRATPFALQPGDIVFVPPTQVATWNQVIDQLLPSLQAVSDVLSPFVSIKYLQQRN